MEARKANAPACRTSTPTANLSADLARRRQTNSSLQPSTHISSTMAEAILASSATLIPPRFLDHHGHAPERSRTPASWPRRWQIQHVEHGYLAARSSPRSPNEPLPRTDHDRQYGPDFDPSIFASILAASPTAGRCAPSTSRPRPSRPALRTPWLLSPVELRLAASSAT